jgi:hypothetical protein
MKPCLMPLAVDHGLVNEHSIVIARHEDSPVESTFRPPLLPNDVLPAPCRAIEASIREMAATREQWSTVFDFDLDQPPPQQPPAAMRRDDSCLMDMHKVLDVASRGSCSNTAASTSSSAAVHGKGSAAGMEGLKAASGQAGGPCVFNSLKRQSGVQRAAAAAAAAAAGVELAAQGGVRGRLASDVVVLGSDSMASSSGAQAGCSGSNSSSVCLAPALPS